MIWLNGIILLICPIIDMKAFGMSILSSKLFSDPETLHSHQRPSPIIVVRLSKQDDDDPSQSPASSLIRTDEEMGDEGDAFGDNWDQYRNQFQLWKLNSRPIMKKPGGGILFSRPLSWQTHRNFPSICMAGPTSFQSCCSRLNDMIGDSESIKQFCFFGKCCTNVSTTTTESSVERNENSSEAHSSPAVNPSSTAAPATARVTSAPSDKRIRPFDAKHRANNEIVSLKSSKYSEVNDVESKDAKISQIGNEVLIGQPATGKLQKVRGKGKDFLSREDNEEDDKKAESSVETVNEERIEEEGLVDEDLLDDGATFSDDIRNASKLVTTRQPKGSLAKSMEDEQEYSNAEEVLDDRLDMGSAPGGSSGGSSSGSDEVPLRMKGTEDGAQRTKGSEEGPQRTKGSEEGAQRTKGSEEGPQRTKGSEEGPRGNKGSNEQADDAMGVEGADDESEPKWVQSIKPVTKSPLKGRINLVNKVPKRLSPPTAAPPASASGGSANMNIKVAPNANDDVNEESGNATKSATVPPVPAASVRSAINNAVPVATSAAPLKPGGGAVNSKGICPKNKGGPNCNVDTTGAITGYGYYVVSHPKAVSRAESVKECAGRNMTLAYLTNHNEDRLLRRLVNGNSTYWIGLTKQLAKGELKSRYRWEDGSDAGTYISRYVALDGGNDSAKEKSKDDNQLITCILKLVNGKTKVDCSTAHAQQTAIPMCMYRPPSIIQPTEVPASDN